MGNGRQEESFRRLEAMGAAVFDRVRNAVDRRPPVLTELGLSPERVLEMLDAPLDRLETVGARPSQLEAIVRMVGRPPLEVTRGRVRGKQTLGEDFPPNVDGLITAVEPLTVSVGRVEFLNHDMAWGGTAWVVAEEEDHLLVATNRHVAALVARRTFRGDGIFMFAPGNVRYRAQVDFIEEVGVEDDPEAVFEIEKFTYLADDAAADIAIGRIAKPAPGAGFRVAPLPLADADGRDGELVAVVGYPARDSLRNDPTRMEDYFKGLYDVKRFSPGFLRVQPGPTILSHDCTTLGGNSGSPVISLCSGRVVGLHFAGRFGVNNSAVRVSTLKAVLDGATPARVFGTAIATSERPDGAHDAAHFEGRPGYDRDFLQVAPVPLPRTRPDIPLSRPSDATDDRPFELRYRNFGVLYSGAVKSPLLAALNIDGALTRPQKRGSDRWYTDGRLPASEQLGKADYDDPAIDRGHLVRRAATNWGRTKAQARQANDDSFHYTAAAPQHMAFNRSTAQWLGLENYIMSSARTHGFRCCVFTGPVFSKDFDEPSLKDTGAPIPLRFFKVVTMLAEDEGSGGILRLHSTAYVLSQVQAIQQLLSDQGLVEAAEGFEFGAYRTFQMRVSDLEEMSGFDFGPLREADPLARRVAEVGAEGPAPRSVFALEDYAGIVL